MVTAVQTQVGLKPSNGIVLRPLPDTPVPWQAVAAQKRRDRDRLLYPDARATRLLRPGLTDALPLRERVLSPLELEITLLPATELASRIAGRVYSSHQVLSAYISAATVAQDATNCLTEICFAQGLARARELDEHVERTGETVGPLHGVPVSIKDHVDVKGLDGASGFVGWAYHRVAAADAVIVRCLRQAGAVIYCKTSNPQSLLAIETNNNIYGRTLNPHNLRLGAGGSTGGEGALIAMHGSPLGVGTDIAGSIRLPAVWNGIYGLKPSVGRLPHRGLQGPHDGMDAIMGAVGPMARSVADLRLFCSTVLSPEIAPWHLEAQTLNKPWSPPSSLRPDRKLVVAVMADDGMVSPHPPVAAALSKAVDRLRRAGHRIVRWDPLRTEAAHRLLFTLLLQDCGKEYRDHLRTSGEPAVPTIAWLLEHRSPDRPVSHPSELWSLAKEREDLRQAAVERWNGLELGAGSRVDAILCPAAPTLAPRPDRTRHWMYTAVWNVLDWPAVTFPTGRSPSAEAGVEWPPRRAPRSEMEEEVWAEWQEGWYTGAPVGLQLVGRRLEEEKLLADMDLVEAALALSD